MIGGISDAGTELCSAEVYDPITRRWSALPVMLTQRAYVGVACLNNCIYAVGGRNEAVGALETVEKYCPEQVTLNSQRHWIDRQNVPDRQNLNRSTGFFLKRFHFHFSSKFEVWLNLPKQTNNKRYQRIFISFI